MKIADLPGDEMRMVDLPASSAGIATKRKVASQDKRPPALTDARILRLGPCCRREPKRGWVLLAPAH